MYIYVYNIYIYIYRERERERRERENIYIYAYTPESNELNLLNLPPVHFGLDISLHAKHHVSFTNLHVLQVFKHLLNE